MRTITENGVAILKTLEQERLLAYDDARPNHILQPGEKVKGTLTIGVGHTGSDVYIGQEISKEESFELLMKDLAPCEEAVYNSVKVPLTDNQFDALVIFTLNVGVKAFKGSTLLKVLNQGKYEEVPAQIKRWNKTTVDGKVIVSEGLNNRRSAEVDLWNNQMQTPTLLNQIKSWLNLPS